MTITYDRMLKRTLREKGNTYRKCLRVDSTHLTPHLRLFVAEAYGDTAELRGESAASAGRCVCNFMGEVRGGKRKMFWNWPSIC